MKKYGIIILISFAASLAACSYPFSHKTTARLPSRQQLCSHLRQQVVFQGNPLTPNYNGPNMTENTPINKARVSNEYQRYNCDQFEPH